MYENLRASCEEDGQDAVTSLDKQWGKIWIYYDR